MRISDWSSDVCSSDLVGAVVALKLGLPAGAALPLTLVASAVGGALWAGIASLLRFWRGVDVVISTLLLNFVAIEVLSFALNKSWLLQATSSNTQKLPQSDRLEERKSGGSGKRVAGRVDLGGRRDIKKK